MIMAHSNCRIDQALFSERCPHPPIPLSPDNFFSCHALFLLYSYLLVKRYLSNSFLLCSTFPMCCLPLSSSCVCCHLFPVSLETANRNGCSPHSFYFTNKGKQRLKVTTVIIMLKREFHEPNKIEKHTF